MIAAAELLDAIEASLARAAELPGRTLVAVTRSIEIDDPSACVFASRRADDRWFCWEQPDQDGFALAGLGSAHEAVSRGARRFQDLTTEIARVGNGRLLDGSDAAPAGAGPIWVGGFAFAPEGGAAPQWSSFPPALLVLPEVSLLRAAGKAWITLAAVVADAGDAERVHDRLGRRVASLRSAPIPLPDPSPMTPPRVGSVDPPRAYEEAVAAATTRIRSGALDKVVLAREVTVETHAAHDAAATFGALRELFPACFCFCCGSPEGAFLGASPELLVRRRGAGVASVALAGSARRSADPAVDDHLGEQLLRSEKDRLEHRFVARRIERMLGPRSVWVEAEKEPGLVKVANIQHLATPVRAQLADPLSAVELAGLLHPTPAVGGEPPHAALAAIEELEAMDRGWYAGPVGWMDAAEDGEFCVALRSALLRDRVAHLFAGAGIVADSDPASELAETELKLEALLPLLAG